MKIKLCLLVSFFLVITACGTVAESKDEKGMKIAQEHTSMSTIRLINATKNTPIKASVISVDRASSTPEDIVYLLDSLDEVQTKVVTTIEEHGWYEIIGESEPTIEEFEAIIRPILEPYFTDSFISSEIIKNVDAFFCYCDAPSPLQGAMKTDVYSHKQVDPNTITVDAYRPEDVINSGAKFKVTLIKQNNTWKINGWEQTISSYDESFQLKPEIIQAYYQVKGLQVTLIDTKNDKDDPVYIFETKSTADWIAVDSKSWFTMAGQKVVEAYYY
ncbi:hypothetical protein [Radiobacillus sp. PE A8.2]|uniref:hypothetical protein n=1 Tax=Radiobacillus sp. PE A8.2 TaxID=3380349 RepID=UPI00389054DE